MSFDVMPGRISGDHRSHRLRKIHADPASQRPAEAHLRADLCSTGKDIWADPKKIRQVRFQVGLVFQYPEYQLFEETVYKDIAFGPANMGLDRRGDWTAVSGRPPRLVGIRDDQLDKSPFELSGGQKRRVALAGVMAMEPQVLILDEPTAGLDPAGREKPAGQHPGLPPQQEAPPSSW